MNAEERSAHSRHIARVKAAQNAGVTLEEYHALRARGFKWCRPCQQWQPHAEFGQDSNRSDGLTSACRAAERAADAKRKRALPKGSKPLIAVYPQLPPEQRQHLPHRHTISLDVSEEERGRLWDGRHAACADGTDPELFFPIGASGPAVAQRAAAKRICRGCPVRTACLVDALEQGDEHGIRGGLDPDERARLTLTPTVVAL